MKANEMHGKILKIKTGYNPNSSSIGADIVVFFTAGAAFTLLFNTAAAIVVAARGQESEKGDSDKLPDLNRGEERK